MNKSVPRPPAAPLIAIAAALLAAWLGMDRRAFEELPSHPTPEEPGAPEQPVLVLAPAMLAPSLVDAISDRPLLAKGRKPVVLDTTADTQQSPEPEIDAAAIYEDPPAEIVSEPPPEVQLLGVIISAGSTRALLRNQYDETEQWLAVGGAIQGWSLVEITQSAVVLRAGADEITIQMFE